jgi:translation initiation factor 3 subunit A
MAREVLYQYKNIAQNVVVGTIEVVIKKFLIAAESKLDDALKKVKLLQMTACDGGYCLIVDLEAEETPEHIIMSTVSAEDSKDRTDRQLVTPGLRFMWEAYRTALDTIRNNVKLEVLYQVAMFNSSMLPTMRSNFVLNMKEKLSLGDYVICFDHI